MVGARPGHADPAPAHPGIPPDTRPGGAYDRYVAKLAAEGKFSGVVLLSHRGRTVLSRSYGMADKEKGIHNSESVAFSLSSAGKPFHAVAVLQLAQQGKVKLSDTVGTHLTGYAEDVAERVTIHHLLSGTSGLSTPQEDVQRVFRSRQEVHEYYEQWVRQSELVAAPGTRTGHSGAGAGIPAQIVEAVTGTTYWDYVQENVFGRCGMTGTAFCTRPQWLTDEHIAHPYMTLYHAVSLVAGGTAGLAALTGLAILLHRRLSVRAVRAATSRSDRAVHPLLACVLLAGLTATFSTVQPHSYDYRRGVSVWFRSLFTLDPDVPAMAHAPLVHQIHALLAMALFALWPFSRLVHAFTAPLGYLARPYVVYRSRGTRRPAAPHRPRPRPSPQTVSRR
ncbi:hypothetical protein GCM10010129_57550 [Streptomyces fumigatiscleroticus]|nr:hypothetical protein GCM10010129_57550 [Streptomyces fumigatiscleroticus]